MVALSTFIKWLFNFGIGYTMVLTFKSIFLMKTLHITACHFQAIEEGRQRVFFTVAFLFAAAR